MRFALIFSCLLCAAQSIRGDIIHPEDGSLRAIHFTDAKEGWAVGDDGIIQHTIDGGATWERQASGTRASLRGVYFFDESVGWAVGREELPFAAGSVGVVLYTKDGGIRWQRLLDKSLPGLNAIRFTDRQTGLMMGDGVEPFTSGLFRTTDGGKSWEPVRGGWTPGWLAGDFQDGKTGILAGPWGRLATFRDDTWASASSDQFAGRAIRDVKILPRRLLAVGDAGLILTSASAGAAWAHADINLAPEARTNLDFHAIAAQGDRVWIVGRPGSVVLASKDGGATWTTQKTGQPLPLHAVAFVDGERGWAVGAGGTILHTANGGASWTTQKRGSARTPLLCVAAQATEIPLDTLAKIAGTEGYHATALAVTCADPTHAAFRQSRMPQRLHQAVRQVGGVVGEECARFPLPQYLHIASKDRILAFWNQSHGGQAERELLRSLVLSLRQWRPDTVIVGDPEASSASALIAEAMVEAARRAEDPEAFPEQIQVLGLSVWKTRSLFAETRGGGVSVETSLWSPILEMSPREAAMTPMATIRDNALSPLPATRNYRSLSGTTNSDLMQGVNAPNGEARRLVPESTLDAKQLACSDEFDVVSSGDRPQ